MPKPAITAIVGVLAASILLGTSLTGCSELSNLGAKHKQVDYATWADAPKAGPTALPTFVPHDAANLYLRTLLDGSGAAITYTSTEPVDTSQCTPGTLKGKPRLNSNWWPIGKLPTTGLVCPHGWQLFQQDGATYGWRNEAR